jgi:hypothetical protein
MWEELVNLVSTIDFSSEDDALIWQHNSSSLYSSQSLYSIINFRGVVPIYIPSVWKLIVPPRIHIFLWLLSKNKILTRDNLEKRRKLDDNTCAFCSEPESVCHLLYDCVVAKRDWRLVFESVGFQVGSNYESVTKLWLCNRRFDCVNMITSAVSRN